MGSVIQTSEQWIAKRKKRGVIRMERQRTLTMELPSRRKRKT